MKPNPFAGLVHSRKFWLLILDSIISIALYFVGKYAGGSVYEDIDFLIKILQPIFVAIIIAIAVEDGASARARASGG